MNEENKQMSNKKIDKYTNNQEKYKDYLIENEQYMYLKNEYKQDYYENERKKIKLLNYLCITTTIISVNLLIIVIPIIMWIISIINY